jgi:uncharacterized protein (AIM24 family)
MDTVFGDGSQQGGFFGKVLGAGKRLLTGEGLFTTIFHNEGQGKRRVAFAAPYPGKIIPVHLSAIGGTLICQKDSFLCAAKGVALGIAFQKRLGVGLFGGEGFIMQKLEGDGLAFVHAGGTLKELVLAPGESLRVDTGCVVAFQPTVDFDIQYVGKIKSAIFGGEGLFFATLRGCNPSPSPASPTASSSRRRPPAVVPSGRVRFWAPAFSAEFLGVATTDAFFSRPPLWAAPSRQRGGGDRSVARRCQPESFQS